MTLTPDQGKSLLDYARAVIRRCLQAPQGPQPDVADAAFDQKAGCFVTLHTASTHRLRGCIGMMHSTQPLRDSVREMAEAVLHDPRFYSDPICAEELPDLDIEITIISPLEMAANTLDFDRIEHGIYLRYAGRSGCFLPQVARETGWSKEQLLNRLCEEKMDLPADSWKRPEAKLLRFTTTILGPERFEP